jgi:hypothetical protein
MAFGGVDVQGGMTPKRVGEVVRVVVDAILFILLFTLATGIWVCLWVPPF